MAMNQIDKLSALANIFKFRGLSVGLKVLIEYMMGLYFIKSEDFPAPLADKRALNRDWINNLQECTRSLVGVEIGVHQGAHAEYILQNLNIDFFYLIDPYQDYNEYQENWHTGDFHRHELLAKKRLTHSNKIKFIKSMSIDAIDLIPNQLDFVYIDGNHDYKFVMEDILNYYPKIRKGGILAGHDYTKEWPGVMAAVDEFADDQELNVNKDIGGDWYILKPYE